MCGIAGFIQGKNSKIEINCNAVANGMADALKHRGPDDKGVWIDDESKVALSYQRLAVINIFQKDIEIFFVKCIIFSIVQVFLFHIQNLFVYFSL